MTATAVSAHTRTETIAGGEIVFDEYGSGAPIVVLHHEIGSPGPLPFYELLGGGGRVIVPDLPGYGRSTRPDWARSVRDLAVLTELLLQRRGVEGATLVGLGFGGWVAAELATMHQSRFTHLVLVNPYGLKPGAGEVFDQFLTGHEEFVRLGFADAARFEDVFGALPDVEILETWDIHREMTTRIAWKPYMYDPALPHLLPMVAIPAVVVAAAGDRILPADCARQYAAGLPRAAFADLPRAGHFAEMEQPEALARLIQRFIAP